MQTELDKYDQDLQCSALKKLIISKTATWRIDAKSYLRTLAPSFEETEIQPSVKTGVSGLHIDPRLSARQSQDVVDSSSQFEEELKSYDSLDPSLWEKSTFTELIYFYFFKVLKIQITRQLQFIFGEVSNISCQF